MEKEERIRRLEEKRRKIDEEIWRLKNGAITVGNIEFFIEHPKNGYRSTLRILKSGSYPNSAHDFLRVRIFDDVFEDHEIAMQEAKKFAKTTICNLQELIEKMK